MSPVESALHNPANPVPPFPDYSICVTFVQEGRGVIKLNKYYLFLQLYIHVLALALAYSMRWQRWFQGFPQVSDPVSRAASWSCFCVFYLSFQLELIGTMEQTYYLNKWILCWLTHCLDLLHSFLTFFFQKIWTNCCRQRKQKEPQLT